MSIEIKEIVYGAYGRCVQLSNGLIDVVVTVEFGPRIIRYGFTGRENVFCEAPELTDANGFKLRGGHRLWHSPEGRRTYELDNSPVKWESIEDGIRTIQDPEPWAQMQKEMDICLDTESTAVTIVHRIRNMGAWPVEFAAWAISVMAPGGKEVVPMTQRDTGLLSNRTLGLWPYSNLKDHRVWWGNHFITIQQDPACKPPFKVGINNEYGWAAYFNHNQVFIKQHIHEMDMNYPDNGMSYETYTTDFMLEMESLSPLMKVEPGEDIEHMECWALVDDIAVPDNCDDCIQEVMDDLLGDACACCDDDCDCCDDGCDCCHDDCDCCDDDCDCDDDEDEHCDCGCHGEKH